MDQQIVSSAESQTPIEQREQPPPPPPPQPPPTSEPTSLTSEGAENDRQTTLGSATSAYTIGGGYTIRSTIHPRQSTMDTIATPIRSRAKNRATSIAAGTPPLPPQTRSSASSSSEASDPKGQVRSTTRDGLADPRVLQLQTKLQAAQAARLKVETEHRNSSKQYEIELKTTQQQLAEISDENAKLWKLIRDVARQQEKKRADGVYNPFRWTDRANFPKFEDFLARINEHHESATENDDSNEDDDNNEGSQNDSRDSFETLNFSIGGMAAFNGHRDFGVASPSMLDSSQAIAELRTPAREKNLEENVLESELKGQNAAKYDGNFVERRKPENRNSHHQQQLELVSPARSQTVDLDDSDGSPVIMADMYDKMMEAQLENAHDIHLGVKADKDDENTVAVGVVDNTEAQLDEKDRNWTVANDSNRLVPQNKAVSSPQSDNFSGEDVASPMLSSFCTPISSHRRPRLGSGLKIQMATPGLSPIQSSLLPEEIDGMIQDDADGDKALQNCSHLSDPDKGSPNSNLNNFSMRRSSHGSHGSVKSAGGHDVDLLSSSNTSNRLQQKLSGVAREMDEDALSEMSSVSSPRQSTADESGIRMLSPLKTPGRTPQKEEREAPFLNNERFVEHSASHVPSRSLLAAKNHKLRLSELEQISDEITRGEHVLSSNQGEVKAMPAPLPIARVVGIRRAGEDEAHAMDKSTSRFKGATSSLDQQRSSGTHATTTESTASVGESVMFSQSTLTGMRRKRSGPNIGAALWEAKQLGITSPETQMEYAHTVVFGSSVPHSSKFAKTATSDVKEYSLRMAETQASSFSKSTVSNISKFPVMGNETWTQSTPQSMFNTVGSTFVAAASRLGSASKLPQRGATDIPHWYINPESSRTSPKSDPIFEFKSLKVNKHIKQYSSSYWASKLGLSRTSLRSRQSVNRTSPILGDSMKQNYEYRSPL